MCPEYRFHCITKPGKGFLQFFLPAGGLILLHVWAASCRLCLVNSSKFSALNKLSPLPPTNSNSSVMSIALPTPTAKTVTFFTCKGRTATSSVLESDVTVCFPSVNITITLAIPDLAPPSCVNTWVFARWRALSMRVRRRWCLTRSTAALKSFTLEYSPNLISTFASSLYEITAICDCLGPILNVDATCLTNCNSLLKFLLPMLPEESTTNTTSDIWEHCSEENSNKSK